MGAGCCGDVRGREARLKPAAKGGWWRGGSGGRGAQDRQLKLVAKAGRLKPTSAPNGLKMGDVRSVRVGSMVHTGWEAVPYRLDSTGKMPVTDRVRCGGLRFAAPTLRL